MHNLVLSPINTDTLIEKIAHRTAELLQSRQPQPTTDQQPDDLITRSEALEYLSITGATLWRYEKQGKIKGYGIGGKRYFRKSELDESLILKK